MTKPHKIERLYAWIVTDDTGEDGIPAMASSMGPMPLIGSDKARIESLRPAAMAAARSGNMPLRLVEFTGAVTLEEIHAAPGPTSRHS